MKNHSSRVSLYLFFSFVAFTSQTIFAQDLDTASISGRVQDQNAAGIPGASIQAMLLKTGSIRTVSTDAEGRFQLIQLEPGIYVLKITASGFAQDTEQLTMVAGQNVRRDVTLSIAGVNASTVVVAAIDPGAVDTKRTVVGTTIDMRDVLSLPVASREVLDLVFTLPGVSEEPLSTRDLAEDRNATTNNTPEEAGTVSLAGAPAYSNNYTVDGLDNNDDRAARERFQPSVEAVEEVQVITNQFSAEYGRASGGRINLRTRSGSRDLTGRVYYYFRDEALNANTFRNNSLGMSRLALQEHLAGFTLAGPLRIRGAHDSPLFFVSFERNQILDSSLIDTLVPVDQNKLFPLPGPTSLQARRVENSEPPALAAEIAPFVSSVSTPLINTNLSSRLDQQFSDLHSGSIVLQMGRLNNLRQFGGGSRLADSLQAKVRNSDALSYSDTYVLSEKSVNQLRLQFSLLSPAFMTKRPKPVVLISINDSLPTTDSHRRSGTLVAGSSTSGGTERQEDRLQIQNIFSHVRGNHALKAGADIHYVRSEFIDLADLTGTFNFASAGDFLAGIPSRYRQSFHTNSVQRNIYSGFFLQDEWQVRPKLMVSYGLRYERESIVRDSNNFGPRVSLAYKPFASDRFVLRLGGGVFYNRALLRTIDDFTLGKQQVYFDTNTLRDQAIGVVMNTGQRRSFIAENLRFPETLSFDSKVVQRFGSINTNFSRRLDPELRIPSSYQINLGAEQYVGRGYSIEANLTFTRGIHLWREFNVNSPQTPSYPNFSEFLISRDFPNFVNASGIRLVYTAASAGELVRFLLGPTNTHSANSIGRTIEFGVPVSLINLNSPTSTTAIDAALAALNQLRPDPSRAEVEQLVSAGNSFYRGLTLELRKQVIGEGSFDVSFRAGYTFSSLIDDGIVNTSDALRPGDFRAERARSLLDRHHRFVLSGVFNTPRLLAHIQLSAIFRCASAAPFNISLGGIDRNLDDVGNDRPNFSGDLRSLHWRAPGESLQPNLIDRFSLPPIGQSGNLPRNAGRGPGLFIFDLNVSREFRIGKRIRLRQVVELDNVLNKRVFSFGAEFIDFNALSPTASEEQRQAFVDSFLLATRTMRPRQIRLGLRLDF